MKCAILPLLLYCLQFPQGFPGQQEEETRSEEVRRDYLVGPGDSLSIGVLGSSEFSQTIRVSNSGKIHIPHIGILRVADKTCAQIQSDITDQLIKRDLIKEPWVQVAVAEYRAHPVYILGEVMQPGQFLIKDEMYVMDLISLTAGFNDVASPVGYLYRREVEAPDSAGKDVEEDPNSTKAIEINFKQLYDGSRPELNMKLKGGDILYVPQRQEARYFIVGDIRSPGVYEIAFGQQILVTQAIAKAGGPTKTAKMSKGMLMRYDQEGKRQEQAVDFKAILEGKEPDFPLRANDIIFIPGSAAKTLGYGLLNIIPNLAATAVLF